MEIDPRLLRNALGAFATGVTIVTTRTASGHDVGLTANSFSSVSLNPPMVLWSLSKASSSIDAFRQTKSFAVHVLASDQDTLSSRFARKGADKFAETPVSRGYDGLPLIDGCTARFECHTVYQYEGGDHVIFVGEVKTFTHSDRAPLVFHGGKYGIVVKTAEDAGSSDPALAGGTTLSTSDLLYLAGQTVSGLRIGAREEKRRHGLSDTAYAVLAVLARNDIRTITHLRVRLARFGEAVDDDLLDGLVGQGLIGRSVENGSEDLVGLTDNGRCVVLKIAALIKDREATALDGLDFAQMQLLKQFLRHMNANLLDASAQSDGRPLEMVNG